MLITEILVEPDFDELRSTVPGQWVEVSTRREISSIFAALIA
jgi:hypothetical protein